MTIQLLTGDDESLLRSATNAVIDQLVGDGDRTTMVDDFDGEDYELRTAVDAAQTPPFLSDRRVVVARRIGRFVEADVAGLLAYLADPLETTDLVLTGGGGALAKGVTAAVKRVGTVTSTSVGAGRARESWLADRVADSGLRLESRALEGLGRWMGEDASRLEGVLVALRATYGVDHRIAWDEVEPLLGDAGGVPPWDFTDAIDRGDTTAALTMLGRMLHAGERHPLQMMATLHRHYGSLARLDGADARTDADAQAATGLKGYPAKKALQQYRRLGGDGVERAYVLLAKADLDLRGRSDLDDEVVMQVLVARLSKLRR